MTDISLDEMQIEKLPTIPHTLLELIRLFENPIVEFDELAEIITLDPAITTRILHLGNTVYFSQWREVTQLKRLLVVLGVDTVRHIALTSAIEHIFTQFDDGLSDVIHTLWYRSLLCAYLAEELAVLSGYAPKEEAYLTGLLHRIGQLVLLCNNPQEYLDAIDPTLDFASIDKAEQRRFKNSSVEIGVALLQQWQMHSFVADALRFQNQPAESVQESTALVRIINLSRQLSDSDSEVSTAGLYAANHLFDLNEGMVQQLLQRARQRASVIASRFSDAPVNPANAMPSVAEMLRLNSYPKRQQLQQQVKNHALTAALRLTSQQTGSNRDIFAQLRRDFHLLFGFRDMHFLLTNAEDNSLCGYDDQGECPQLCQVVIPLDTSTSLATLSLQEKHTLCTADRDGTVISISDLQLCNLMGTEAVCFIPLATSEYDLGVIVAGVSSKRWQALSQQGSLFQLAAQLAAQSINQNQISTEKTAIPLPYMYEQRDLNLRSAIHEINNPLSIINNYLHLLADKLTGDQQPPEEISIIQEEIGRVSTLVAGLRDLTQTNAIQESSVDINLLIKQLQTLLSTSLFQSHDQQFLTDLDPELTLLTTDGNNLKQILINLLKNASEALPQGGEVILLTRNQVYKNGSQFVSIEVRDNGPGIDASILTQLYKPVTSTKQNHSGIGLTIVKNLVDRLDGEIICSSSEQGTSFQILLPRLPAQETV